jgi:hypothetical protein
MVIKEEKEKEKGWTTLMEGTKGRRSKEKVLTDKGILLPEPEVEIQLQIIRAPKSFILPKGESLNSSMLCVDEK